METKLDFRVRIATSELYAVELSHLTSEKDSSIAAPPGASKVAVITGFTEWVGSWRAEIVSVGWDWGVVNGIVVLLSQNEIRTNIQLISPDDRQPVAPMIAQIHLFHWIESLPWREIATNDLLHRTS
jgi:hypothetical protein